MRYKVSLRAATAVATVVAVILGLGQAPGWAESDRQARPTVVIVHGAFADAGDWDQVIGDLQGDGYPVLAVANPLRGLGSDSRYVARLLKDIPGPVVLVGHSYGGAVISQAAVGADNVKALVYVAAFAPDQHETLGQLSAQFPNSLLTEDALVPHALSRKEGDVELSIAPGRYRDIFAADLPRSQGVRMASRQRPVHGSVFTEEAGVPAWKSIPSWYLVAAQDRAIDPAAERFFAKRMNARTTEVKASHSVFVSRPNITTTLITAAARAVR